MMCTLCLAKFDKFALNNDLYQKDLENLGTEQLKHIEIQKAFYIGDALETTVYGEVDY